MGPLSAFVMVLDIVALLGMLCYIVMTRGKTSLHKVFFFVILELIVWDCAAMMAAQFAGDPQTFVFVDNFSYFGAAFVPATMLMLGFAYQKNFQGFDWRYAVFHVVPAITMVLIFTNESHHLFYLSYSAEGGYVQGPLFYVYAIYSYICLAASMTMLYVTAARTKGMLSPQCLLILAACLLPLVVNLLYTLHVPGFQVYSTPVAFSVTVLLLLVAMFRFGFLKVVPVAMQTAINRISDCFAVVDRDMHIVNYNEAFVRHFVKDGTANADTDRLDDALVSVGVSPDQITAITWCAYNAFETSEGQSCSISLDGENPRYYTVEFAPVADGTQYPALVVLLKDVTQHVLDMKALRDNQDILMEKERLASLGQMMGGIAHNLKSPILAISGAVDQVQCLVDEYRESAGDAEVTPADHREIAQEMTEWLAKTKMQLAYMSDIITTVKGQVTKMSERETQPFTIGEVVKRVQLLMHHSLAKGGCVLDVRLAVSDEQVVFGDVNSLVQVLDNVVDNAIQAYGEANAQVGTQVGDQVAARPAARPCDQLEGQPAAQPPARELVQSVNRIVLSAEKTGGDILFSVADKAGGLRPDVQKVLFKEMVTTKGKNGTGLGLYLSYSTVKGVFQGTMWFETETGRGTTFFIRIPVKNAQ